jgi:transcriptional regulator with XRE-family HTH domain
MRKSKAKRTMTDALKAEIEECGVSRYEISKATGILQTSLSRFMRGETSLRLDKADALAEYLGLELAKRKT